MRANNLKTLIKDEMVNRFEAVVSDEVRQHNKCIQENKKEVEELKSKIQELTKKQENLEKTYQELKDNCVKEFLKEKNDLLVEFQDHIKYVNKNFTSMNVSANDMLKFCSTCVDQDQFKKYINEINEQILGCHRAICMEKNVIIERNDNIRKELIESINFLEQLFHGKFEKMNIENAARDLQIDVNKVDYAGILKELKVYKKSMFIIEKKIEHIYEQLKRIKEKA